MAENNRPRAIVVLELLVACSGSAVVDSVLLRLRIRERADDLTGGPDTDKLPQALERLRHVDLAEPLEGPGPEAGVEQMQDRMLNPSDILSDREPAVGFGDLPDRMGIDALRVARDIVRIRLWASRGVYDVSTEELRARYMAALRRVDADPEDLSDLLHFARS